MFPQNPQDNPLQSSPVQPNSGNTRLNGQNKGTTNEDPYHLLVRAFVGEARSQLATLTGEIALRNKVISTNDAYVYGDLLARSLDIPVGHDFTPVNWLRRVAEIHRIQTIAEGFSVGSSYHGDDTDAVQSNPQAVARMEMQNNRRKQNAEARGKIFEAIMRDNGGDSLWARLVENASVVGTSVLKAWFDDREGKYKMEMIESVEHFYALWSRSNFRAYDMTAFVYQISKQKAVKDFNVPPDVATSPLGMPLAVLSSANTIEYISTQPMVTIMEVNGKVQGWCTDGNGMLMRCAVGQETPLNAVIVGDRVKQIIDDPKHMPHFYIFPNKMIRKRPWGLPDITTAAVQLNQTFIETLSDWRTVASRINFPKYKAFGFGMDTQLPKPKPRAVEMIGLGEGQDIQGIQTPAAPQEIDFQHQIAEIKEEFVRETGISQLLFDNPDAPSNYQSNQTMMTAMRSISDQVSARRQLWEPIIVQIFEDALDTLALWDDNIKELIQSDDNWYVRVQWPPSLRSDDPAYQTMLINRINTNTISIQSFMERLGENGKEELDRIRDEMDDPFTAAIHGKMVQLMAEYKIAGPPSMTPPKVNVSLSGVLTPEQEANLSVMHDFGQGPVFGPTAGPQGEQGTRANTDYVDQGLVTGQMYPTGQPLNFGPTPQAPANPNANPAPPQTGGAQGQPAQQPNLQSPPQNNQAGQQPVSAPGSGQATPTSSQGAANKAAQQGGK
jgi:hypothetical protein